MRGRDLASFVAEAQQAVDAQVELPPGWTIEWGGQFENLQAASGASGLLVPLALLLIFVLLYSTFGSVRLAILIFFNVPLAVTGGLSPWRFAATRFPSRRGSASSPSSALPCSTVS